MSNYEDAMMPNYEDVIIRIQQVGALQTAKELNECMGIFRKQIEAWIEENEKTSHNTNN